MTIQPLETASSAPPPVRAVSAFRSRLRLAALLVAAAVVASGVPASADHHEEAMAPKDGAMMKKKAMAGGHDHAESAHRIISILPSSLLPMTRRLSPNDTFGWLNYTNDEIAVSFDVDVARRLTCVSRTLFAVAGERFEAELDAGGFASLCKLSPGTYPYTVRVGPRPPLRGTLIVEG